MQLQGKTVLVTGGASGIGLATCRAFADAGAQVLLTDVNAERGEQEAAALRQAGGKVQFMPLDITDRASVEAIAPKVQSALGRLDVLVNAAGWDVIQPFMDNTPEYWAKIIALNFMGPVQVTRALLPLLFESGSGRIVNVGSDAGRVGSYGETVYAGREGRHHRLHQVACPRSRAQAGPGQLRLPGPDRYTACIATHSEKMQEALINAIPMKRLAKPAEVADAILFFASDRSSFVTGQVLSVSGGLTMVD